MENNQSFVLTVERIITISTCRVLATSSQKKKKNIIQKSIRMEWEIDKLPYKMRNELWYLRSSFLFLCFRSCSLFCRCHLSCSASFHHRRSSSIAIHFRIKCCTADWFCLLLYVVFRTALSIHKCRFKRLSSFLLLLLLFLLTLNRIFFYILKMPTSGAAHKTSVIKYS